ncbi:hypothetical protein LCGC14_1320420 [marine sediment metagenome]|uniref:Response regulatory domain-containing protein n=1 Tax=marine sediment metagenome TaxID=412755 RepID=A0A0F9KJR9_9ZZZZ
MSSIILIVDDNMDFLVNLQLTLEFNNYQAISAENGIEAINVLRELKELPILIISDILMPEMNGYEFFRTISKNPKWKNIPFLFITGYSPIEDDLRSEKIIEDDIMIKPYKEDELLQIISEKIV